VASAGTQSARVVIMLEHTFQGLIETGLQAVGWAVLKGMTLGRYRGFQPEDVLVEGHRRVPDGVDRGLRCLSLVVVTALS
jgi:hypothetical protein